MSTLDLTGTGTLPAGGHRLAVPSARIKAFFSIVILVLSAWGAVRALDKPTCAAFSQQETRELAGLPIPPECVSARIPPDGPFSGVTP